MVRKRERVKTIRTSRSKREPGKDDCGKPVTRFTKRSAPLDDHAASIKRFVCHFNSTEIKVRYERGAEEE